MSTRVGMSCALFQSCMILIISCLANACMHIFYHIRLSSLVKLSSQQCSVPCKNSKTEYNTDTRNVNIYIVHRVQFTLHTMPVKLRFQFSFFSSHALDHPSPSHKMRYSKHYICLESKTVRCSMLFTFPYVCLLRTGIYYRN